MPKIVLITGTPATGKSTVAKLLKLKDSIVINSKFFKVAISGYDKKRKVPIVDEKKFDRLLQKIAKKYDYVIVESVFAGSLTGDKCFVLRCDIKELRKRLKKRRYSKKKIEENIESEIVNVCGEEAFQNGYNVIEIDTTKLNASATAEKILNFIGR